jgi:hypothetical protein
VNVPVSPLLHGILASHGDISFDEQGVKGSDLMRTKSRLYLFARVVAKGVFLAACSFTVLLVGKDLSFVWKMVCLLVYLQVVPDVLSILTHTEASSWHRLFFGALLVGLGLFVLLAIEIPLWGATERSQWLPCIFIGGGVMFIIVSVKEFFAPPRRPGDAPATCNAE